MGSIPLRRTMSIGIKFRARCFQKRGSMVSLRYGQQRTLRSLKIRRDESWKLNIDILTDFYFHKLFPNIVEREL